MSETSCLRDKGEDNWPVKLHLGCGGIYLGNGYTNIDSQGLLASDHPELVKANLTTIDNYYAGLSGDIDNLPQRRQTVVDVLADITQLTYAHHTVDKIIGIQVFEHLSPVKALDTLCCWYDMLRPFRVIVLSVPDMTGTLDLIEGNWRFALRHLRGRGDDDNHTHRAWYTRETFGELLQYCGFKVEWLPNVHFYPSLVARGVKV